MQIKLKQDTRALHQQQQLSLKFLQKASSQLIDFNQNTKSKSLYNKETIKCRF